MPHYDRAPIAEAIIDLRVEWPGDAPEGALEGLAERLKGQFPKNEPISSILMGFAVPPGEEVSFSTASQQVGRRLDSADGKRVLQMQHGGFTYSHLPQYTDWQHFSAEAFELWNLYVEAARIKTAIRAAVRVVNKIALPGSFEDLPKFTNLLPQIPRSLPTLDAPYFFQVQGAGAVDGSRVIINSGRAQNAEGQWEFLLDFDLFVDRAFDARSQEIWDLLVRLSAEKNTLFEACITDDFRSLIR